MDPTTAFVMALAALAVSLGSFGVSAASFWRSRTPKPRWVTNVKIIELADGERRVTGSITNRGRGVALDVTFEPENIGLLRVLAQRKAKRLEFGESFDVTMTYGPDVEGDGTFLLTWSHEPHVYKRRTKRLKFSLKAIGDPNTRRGRRLREKR